MPFWHGFRSDVKTSRTDRRFPENRFQSPRNTWHFPQSKMRALHVRTMFSIQFASPCCSTSCLAISSKFQRIKHQCRWWPDVSDRSTIPEHSTIEFCGSRASRHRKILSRNTHDHEAMQLELRLSSCIIFILLLSDFLGTYLGTQEKSYISHKRLWRLCTFDYLCKPWVIIPSFWSILANRSVWWSWQL